MTRINQRFIRYLLVGAGNTFFSLALYYLLLSIFSDEVSYLLLFWVSSFLGIINGYIWQRLLVWKSQHSWKSEIIKFFTLNILVACINSVALYTSVTLFSLDAFTAQLFITVSLVLLSFFVSKIWVFSTSISNSDTAHKGN